MSVPRFHEVVDGIKKKQINQLLSLKLQNNISLFSGNHKISGSSNSRATVTEKQISPYKIGATSSFAKSLFLIKEK